MGKRNGAIGILTFAVVSSLATACGTSQINKDISYESPMQCYKESKLKSAGLSLLVGGAINYATYLGAKYASYGKPQIDNYITFFENYYSWGQCLHMFSGLTTHQEAENDAAVKYSWVPPNTKLLQIDSFTLDQADVKPGASLLIDIIYRLKAPTDSKEIEVTQTRRLKLYDTKEQKYIEVGKVQKTINLLPGKYRSDGYVSTPDDIEGKFMLDVEFAAYGVSEHVQMPFVVIDTH